MLGRGEEICELLECHRLSLLILESIKPTTLTHNVDNEHMITLIAIAVPLAVMVAVDALALKYGADTRPGFDERNIRS